MLSINTYVHPMDALRSQDHDHQLSTTGTATATGPVTVVEVPAATATIVKQGEIAQSGVGPKEDVR